MRKIRFMIVLLLAMALAAPASAGWKVRSDNTGPDVNEPTIKYRGKYKQLFHQFTGTGSLDVIRVANGTLAKFCLNANTGGIGANGVVAKLLYSFNSDPAVADNDSAPVINFTFTGDDGEDCMYDNDPGFYRLLVTDAPDVNASYLMVIRTKKTE